jgi:hypothetical protein
LSTFYLRIEGVNLSYVLEDTNQLSVVRGSSLLLRQAVKDIEAEFPALRKISTGASIGLFQFETDGEEEVKDLHDKIVGFLSKDWRYKHFTFVVDIQAAADNFLSDKEAVLARNRFRQLQQLSLAVPPQNTKRHEPCKWDGLRSGNRKLRVREDQKIVPKAVSESIIVRHAHGRPQKQRFYAQEIAEKCQDAATLPKIKSLQFARDLHEIGGTSPYRNLNDKIAVIYLDGNGFSKIQAKHCQSADALGRWDEYIQGKRCEFLKDFLLRIQDDPDFKTQDGAMRLETLLWGGDEITLVTPA